jgi:transposase
VVCGLISDQERAFFTPFVIEPSRRRGRPLVAHRRVRDAVLSIGRTSVPWRDLPRELGDWDSAHRRYRRWTASGLRSAMPLPLGGDGSNDVLQVTDSTTDWAPHIAARAGAGLRTRLWTARATASRSQSTFGPTLRACCSLCNDRRAKRTAASRTLI